LDRGAAGIVLTGQLGGSHTAFTRRDLHLVMDRLRAALRCASRADRRQAAGAGHGIDVDGKVSGPSPNSGYIS